MFCIGGRFLEGRFVEDVVLYRRTFCMGGRFVEGRLVGRTFGTSTKIKESFKKCYYQAPHVYISGF